jgi:predicted acetyltransferase
MPGAPPTASGRPLVRPAREDDVDRLLEIHVAAFPDPRPIEVRRRVFMHNRLGGLGALRVAELDGDVVAHAFAFPIAVWFGGRRVRGTALASVGVAVEARGRGLATALVGSIHDEATVRGDAFALLYPFRQAFYARLGYAPLARHRVLSFSPRAVPAAWGSAAPGVVRRARAHDRERVAAAYQAAAAHGAGFLERDERAWEHDLLEERHHWLVLDDSGSETAGGVKGYVVVRLLQTEPHARVVADVRELIAPSHDARRRLLAAVATLGDQVGEITMALADDDPLDWGLVDADRDRGGTKEVEHAYGVVNLGPMLRLLDAAAALRARGYASDGRVGVAVDGGAPFTLEVEGGVARVATGARDGCPVLHLSSQTLAAVAFGGLRLEDAARLGWLGPTEPEAVLAGAPLLRLPAFFAVDAF